MRFTFRSRIYLDHAAATPLDTEVLSAMRGAAVSFGNPSSPHYEGREAHTKLEALRVRMARILGSHADEIVFTSGGTESNNLAIFGVVEPILRKQGRAHIISSHIEHSSVLEVLEKLSFSGAQVTLLPVDGQGRVSLSDLKNSLTEDTVLVSFAAANGEIGSCERLREISQVLRAYREGLGRVGKSAFPYIHTDASQAACFMSVRPGDLGVDFMTLDASKMYGPKGSGLLYVRRGISMEPLFQGGGQEGGRRSGTENVTGVSGMVVALEKALKMKEKESLRMRALSVSFMNELKKKIPQASFNSDPEKGLPNLVSVTLPVEDAEYLAVQLDQEGVAASSASACRSIGQEGSSYVIEALPGKEGYGKKTMRFSLGRSTRESSLFRTVAVLERLLKSSISKKL